MWLYKTYRVLNTLSLDVALGAVLCAAFFMQVFGLYLPISEGILLFLAVWIVYACDHLLDTASLTARASTQRHRFHQKFRKQIKAALLVAMGASIVVLFFIEVSTFQSGVWLVLFVGLYLVGQRNLKSMKEFFGATFYCAGVLLPGWSRDPGLLIDHSIIVIQFFLIAYANLLAFAYFDRESDRLDDHVSFVRAKGEKTSVAIINILLIASMMASLADDYMALSSLVMFGMGLLTFIIFQCRTWLANDEIFRIIGDAVFLFPVLSLL